MRRPMGWQRTFNVTSARNRSWLVRPAQLTGWRNSSAATREWLRPAATVAAVLVLGLLGSTWHAVRATRAAREQSRLREAAVKAQSGARAAADRAQTLTPLTLLTPSSQH